MGGGVPHRSRGMPGHRRAWTERLSALRSGRVRRSGVQGGYGGASDRVPFYQNRHFYPPPLRCFFPGRGSEPEPLASRPVALLRVATSGTGFNAVRNDLGWLPSFVTLFFWGFFNNRTAWVVFGFHALSPSFDQAVK